LVPRQKKRFIPTPHYRPFPKDLFTQALAKSTEVYLRHGKNSKISA